MKTLKTLTLIFGIIILISCKQDQKEALINTAVVYSGGDIITMQGDLPEYAEALVIKDGKIEFVGSSADAMVAAGEGHQMINLNGKTLMPGFIDPHSHFINSLGMSSQANCSPSPVGELMM